MRIFAKLKHYFIPHSGNDFKPHALQKTAVVGMMGLVVLSFTVANLQSLLWITSDWMVSTILPAVIVSETNEERVGEQLAPLVRNSVLDAAAQKKAEDMAQYEYFAHYSPEGVSPWYWFDQVDYTYLHAGENLAVHFTDSSDVVQAWMKSPTHRDNILNDDYQEIGIGTAQGEYEGFPTVYVVQLFGTRQAIAAGTTAGVEVELKPDPESELVATSEPVELALSPDEVVEPVEVEEPVTETELAETATSSSPVLAVAGEEATSTPEVKAEEVYTVSTASPPMLVTDDETKDEPDTFEAAAVSVDDYGAVVYSDHISTSTTGIPASIESQATGKVTTPPNLAFVTQPHVVLQVIYVLLGFFITLTLILSIVIEIRRQQPAQIAYGLALMAVMLVLFKVHMTVSGGVLIT